METYEYNLDTVNLEIFPDEIWRDPHIVFHGTSEFHSERIERNGFIPSTSPFDLSDARELIRVLQLPDIAPFDTPRGLLSMSVAQTLQSYIAAIEKGSFRLSFGYLSFLCVFFSEGPSKGGQTLGTIREARMIIEKAIQANPEAKDLVTEPIHRLFQLENDVANARGIIYAVKLIPPFKGVTDEYGTLHSTVAIPPENIIAKVILPNDLDCKEFESKMVKERNKQKLTRPGHLGILLNRMKMDDLE